MAAKPTIHVEFNTQAAPLIKSVARAASTDDTRPGLLTVNLSPFDRHGQPVTLADAAYVDVWATDSYRVHTVRFDKRSDRAARNSGDVQVRVWEATHAHGAALAITDAGLGALAEHATYNSSRGVKGRSHVVSLPAKPLLTAPSGNADKHPLQIEVNAHPDGSVPSATMTARYGPREASADINPSYTPDMHQLWPDDLGDRTIVFTTAVTETAAMLARFAKIARAMGTVQTSAGTTGPAPLALRDTRDGLRARLGHTDAGVTVDIPLTLADTNNLGSDVYGFNPQYLADAAAHADIPVLRIRDNLKPAVFGTLDTAGALLMPVRVDDMPRIAPLAGVDASAERLAANDKPSKAYAGTPKCDRDHVTDDTRASIQDLSQREDRAVRERDQARKDAAAHQTALAHTTQEKDRLAQQVRELEGALTASRRNADNARQDLKRTIAAEQHAAADADNGARDNRHPTDPTPLHPVPNNPTNTNQRATRKEQNRQLAAALRARGITPHGQPWDIARQALTAGATINTAADKASAARATA